MKSQTKSLKKWEKRIKKKIFDYIEESDGALVEAPKKVFEANSILVWFKEEGYEYITPSQLEDSIGRVLSEELELEWTEKEDRDKMVPMLNKP